MKRRDARVPAPKRQIPPGPCNHRSAHWSPRAIAHVACTSQKPKLFLLNGRSREGHCKGARKHMSDSSFSVAVQHVLDQAPPLSEEKRDKITTLLLGGDDK